MLKDLEGKTKKIWFKHYKFHLKYVSLKKSHTKLMLCVIHNIPWIKKKIDIGLIELIELRLIIKKFDVNLKKLDFYYE